MSAIVVGANGLIGNAVTRSLARHHAVWVVGRDASALQRLATSTSGRITAVPLDATDDAALQDAIGQAAADGGLQVAVNNIGLSHRPTPLGELGLDEFDRVIATTLRAVAAAMKFELGHMGSGAAIVNVASSAGLSGTPGMSAYAAAKYGVIGLTHTAAIDYGERGIRVNAVAPGPIESGPIMAQSPAVRERVGGYTPLGRMGSAQEVANAVTWLASPEAGYVTGTTLSVDGGKTA
ncbi:SDR family NAD(P)-dependent oxidoreductase [Allobranchiibius sp. CTAmp26]|uniref:SDR family NAD(P)-dependent oxidoreductase n=1 Tax=Allobranchiibius sp. CTAmp26 TaxID=2815214 RepID=UPI001AA0CA33|nr:SDR family NAD(P)-dependent oxidoreductase [Allobranchiibius sp. CTAmp26]MBO1753927.1 SDR family oxidoreductase [Allobranchiibius sp. CTAmp26]